jgi:hypothetical protein
MYIQCNAITTRSCADPIDRHFDHPGNLPILVTLWSRCPTSHDNLNHCKFKFEMFHAKVFPEKPPSPFLSLELRDYMKKDSAFHKRFG